jgi:hypothetical protein
MHHRTWNQNLHLALHKPFLRGPNLAGLGDERIIAVFVDEPKLEKVEKAVSRCAGLKANAREMIAMS